MIANLKYAWYLARHKWFVLVAGLKLGGIPLWRLLIHDYSKLSRAEWRPYVNRFFRPCTCTPGVYVNTTRCPHHQLGAPDPEEFHRAFEHHWKRNPHHWEFWSVRHRGEDAVHEYEMMRYPELMELGWGLLYDADDKTIEMPEHFAREMVADWMGAGRAKTGHWDIKPWYTANCGRMNLHPNTRVYVQKLVFG